MKPRSYLEELRKYHPTMPANWTPPTHDPQQQDLLRYVEEKGVQWAFQKFVAHSVINWKTSMAGISAILIGVAGEIDYVSAAAQPGGHFTLTGFLTLLAPIAAGVGGLFAKDSDKTSEQNNLVPVVDAMTGKVIPRAEKVE